jgi:hypothetical protein
MKVFKLAILLFLFKQNIYAQNTTKPWAYWWWPASAVNKPDLRANLQKYAEAGFGGLHIIPIYGVKGNEENFIYFLSPKWIEMVNYTVSEAHKLGLGIDMSLGTGWPFGGTEIKPEHAAKTFELVIDSAGSLSLITKNTNQKVKRAAPGGEGLVLDHFNKSSVEYYFSKFDTVFSKNNVGIRAFYNDSYEVYGADWTHDFFKKFEEKRGYRLNDNLGVFENKKSYTEAEKQIYSDYQLTISELLLEEFTKPFANFASKYGKLSRNESHGSPGNVLDLYAANSIPETEFFGSKPFDIPLYRQDPDYKESQFGRPNRLVLKLASSPAHLLGKKLVSSETATWLGNHFKVNLAQIKPIIDESFLGGVNHIFYHGATYTPMSASWPGWLFYASTNFNFNSHFWNELPHLNKYIENCQKILQNSKPDNEILVYFPIQDLWHKPKKGIYMMDVHNIEKSGIFNDKYRSLLEKLESSGYSFDFISDLQLGDLEKGNIKNTAYKSIIIPEIEYMPLETLKSLKALKNSNFDILFENKLPQKTTGYFKYENNQKIFQEQIIDFKQNVSADILRNLKKKKIRNESLTPKGLDFIRKSTDNGIVYFLNNSKSIFYADPITFKNKYKYAYSYQALTDQWHEIIIKSSGKTKKVFIDLPPGQSVFLFFTNKKIEGIKEYSIRKFKNVIDLNSDWHMIFNDTQILVPNERKLSKLESWTIADSSARYYNGYGTYQKDFSLPENAIGQKAIINLGDVRETAEVYINDQKIGTAWSLPYKLEIPEGVLKKENQILIKVKNLSANQIIYLDQQKVPWKSFYDINIVDIQYKPFDASGWEPVDSGLLGPVYIEY